MIFKTVEDKLEYLLKDLLKENECYDFILDRGFRFKEFPGIPTAAMDTKNFRILYNSKFLELLTGAQVKYIILAHELLHYIFMHDMRIKKLDKFKPGYEFKIHNIAADLEVNNVIRDKIEQYKLKDKLCLSDTDQFPYPRELSYEEYFEKLINEPNRNNNQENQDQMCNIQRDMDGSKAQQDQKDNPDKDVYKDPNGKYTVVGNTIYDHSGELTNPEGSSNEQSTEDLVRESISRTVLKKMKDSGMNIGKGQAYLDDLAKIEKIKYPWTKVLRSVVIHRNPEITSGKRYESYSKYNIVRSMISDETGIIFPGTYDRKISMKLAIIMDISGSMGQLTEKMYGLLRSIRDEFEGKLTIDVFETDTEVETIRWNLDSKKSAQKVGAGGGTDMESGLRYIDKDKKLKYDLHIIMTDNYVPWEGIKEHLKDTIVITNNKDVSKCPYKVYEAIIE